jgi:hypothetical protein
MERLYSKIIGMGVFVPESVRPVRTVQDLVIDPANGRVIALVVDARRGLIIVPSDILGIKHGVYIRDRDDIIEASDVLRVMAVMNEYGGLIGKKVVGEGAALEGSEDGGSAESEDERPVGDVIGKVNDYVIDGRGLVLKKIYTSRSVLGMFHFDNRIIGAKSIVEIRPEEVVVKDVGKVAASEKVEAASRMAAAG